MSDLSVSCCAASGTLSVVSVSGDCVNAPHDDDSQELHIGVGADQHLPEDRTGKQPSQFAAIVMQPVGVLHNPISMCNSKTNVPCSCCRSQACKMTRLC